MSAVSKNRMKVGCIQMRSGIDIDENIASMDALIRQAANLGVRYVQTPEMTGILQKQPKKLFAAISNDQSDRVFERAGELAKQLDIWVHIGSTAVDKENGKAANRAGLFAPSGKRVASYDKIHMFDVDLDNGESWLESRGYDAGNQCVVAEVDGNLVGIAICYDLRFPHLFRHQAKAGAGILTCPAAFTRQTGEAHWHTLLQSRAIENGAFVIAAAQGGVHEDGRQTFGHSMVVNPWGEIIAEIDGDQPGVLVAEIDLGEVNRARGKIPSLENERMFSITSIAPPDGGFAGELA